MGFQQDVICCNPDAAEDCHRCYACPMKKLRPRPAPRPSAPAQSSAQPTPPAVLASGVRPVPANITPK